MRLPFVFIVLLFQPLLLQSHSDPAFLSLQLPYQFISGSEPARAFGNPALFPSGNRLAWFTGVTNHYGVSNFNTMATGITLSNRKSAISFSLAHSPLPENRYYRTKGALNFSLLNSDGFSSGISLRSIHIRLPDNYGSSTGIGGAAGVIARPGKKLTCGFAAGYTRFPESGFAGSNSLVNLIADVSYKFSHNATLLISAEMIQEQKPQASAILIVEVVDRINMMFGAGTGSELFSAGASISFGSLRSGAVSSFNPAIGRTGSMFISGKSRKP